MTPVYDEAVNNSLATVQAQLATIQAQLAATPTPGFSSSLYPVQVISPTNNIDLQVQHIVTTGDLFVSSLLVVVIMGLALKYLFNGIRGVSL